MSVRMTQQELDTYREGQEFEAKLAQGRNGNGDVPRSIWETYSAMANTDGGILLLGAEEREDGSLDIKGIKDIERVRRDFWNTVQNPQKVSLSILSDADVRVIDCDGVLHPVLLVSVPAATRQQRPIYIDGNPLTGTFLRRHEGDYRCRQDEVERMLAERKQESRDEQIFAGYSLEDLDAGTLQAYRQEVHTAKPQLFLHGLPDQEYLTQIGAWRRDRTSGASGPTLAGILMFGTGTTLSDAVPGLILDYREFQSNESNTPWAHRIHHLDGTWSGNLFDFFRMVRQRFARDLDLPFRMEGTKRIDDTPVHKALREALVDTLIHGDYSIGHAIRIDRHPARFVFSNPGRPRIPTHQIYEGGVSDCRNRRLQKMFQYLGEGEQGGMGYPTIVQAWRGQHWQVPLLEADESIERTILRMPMVVQLPPEALDELLRRFGDSFRSLDTKPRIALVTALTAGKVTNEHLRFAADLHASDATLLLRELVQAGFLKKNGERRNAYYTLLAAAEPIQAEFGIREAGESLPAGAVDGGALKGRGGNPDATGGDEGFAIGWAENHPAVVGVRSSKKPTVALVEDAIVALCRAGFRTPSEIAEVLNRSERTLERYLTPLVRKGLLQYRFPETPNHPQQAYRSADR